MKIKEIEIFWLDVPFHDAPQRNMARTLAGWHICEICRVTTDNGLVGYGETLPNYTWGKVSAAAIERTKGRNPFDLMWDDTLGAGLQMALFDVAGKAAGVPVYALLGKKAGKTDVRGHPPGFQAGLRFQPISSQRGRCGAGDHGIGQASPDGHL